jgi:hypothetical protein
MYRVNDDSSSFLFIIFFTFLAVGLFLGFYGQLFGPLNIVVAIVTSPIMVYGILSQSDIKLKMLTVVLTGFSLGLLIINIPAGYILGQTLFANNTVYAVLYVLALPAAFLIGSCIGGIIYYLRRTKSDRWNYLVKLCRKEMDKIYDNWRSFPLCIISSYVIVGAFNYLSPGSSPMSLFGGFAVCVVLIYYLVDFFQKKKKVDY